MNSTSANTLSLAKMIRAGLRHSWKINTSVALGVATATAVIVGALLVGDSMKGSLRALTTERLGKTNTVLAPGAFFSPEGIVPKDINAYPLMLFTTGVGETFDDSNLRRSGSLQIIGCDDNFWQLDTAGIVPKEMPGEQSVVLNSSAAQELGVSVGDEITLRLPEEQAVPADSTLGKRDIRTQGLPRMKVVDVIADRGLGRFSMAANQAAPKNVYVARSVINEVLDRDGQANVVLLDSEIKTDQLSVGLGDLGLSLTRMTQRFPKDDESDDAIVFDYYSLVSDRLLIQEAAVDKLKEVLPEGSVTEVSTYLANAIERLNDDGTVAASVPYSIVTAIDNSESLPLNFELPESIDKGLQGRVPVVINNWAAERLSATVGTPLRLAYYEPEVEDGLEIERFFDAVVTQVVEITEPTKPYGRRNRPAVFGERPTVYNDPNLTPDVPGVTDQRSINDWDLPFPLKRKTNSDDDDYWNNHRLTPKAFIPLAKGQELFGSRFGKTTGLRIATSAGSQDQLEKQISDTLQPLLDDLGWQPHAIRDQQLAAAKGTTPFDGLFLSLSFFVIFAAIMLITMLFRLGLVQRIRQFGTLLAVGWTPKRIGKLTLGEGLIVSSIGVALGVLGGVLYAKLVLWGLRTLWVGAVTVPFLRFYASPQSLLIGAVSGWAVGAITLWWTLRSLLKRDAQSLVSGREDNQVAGIESSTQQRKFPVVPTVMAVCAVLIAIGGAIAGGQAAAGGFVGGGMLLLIAILFLMHARLRLPRRIAGGTSQATAYSVNSLATRSASRNPLRSTLTIGLMATAAFLIIAMAALQLQPTEKGTGGFDLIARSATPLYKNFRDKQVRRDLMGEDAGMLPDNSVVTMRMRPGQDASCNNLYQASQPTVLGVPDELGEIIRSNDDLPGFAWASHETIDEGGSPWDLLNSSALGTEADPLPVVLDQNTAMWALQMGGIGKTRSFDFPEKELHFKVVGLLSNSVLQGRLLIGDDNFKEHFPRISGSQFFLFACDEADRTTVASALESRLGDIGMDVSDSADVLSGMLAVQNTYLRTFQSLGALGLLLGTIGLAVAQLRGVLERRKELAVMRAIGFSRKRLARVVLTETATLLLLGIGCGAICAIIAVLPYAWLSGTRLPVLQPVLVVIGIIAFGLLAGLVAVRQVLRIPLIDALRPE